MEIELFDDVPVFERASREGRYSEIISNFLKTDSRTLKFSAKNEQECKNIYSSAKQYAKKRNLDYTVYREKGKNNIYIIRGTL